MSREKMTRMVPYQTSLQCGHNGCAGWLEYAGESVTMGHTEHKHRCTQCSRFEWLTKRYPYIDHFRAEDE